MIHYRHPELLQTPEFRRWFAGLDPAVQVRISTRLRRIRDRRHLGDCRELGGGLAELRWRRGVRVYFAIVDGGRAFLALYGGFKDGQKKDVRQARSILERYAGAQA